MIEIDVESSVSGAPPARRARTLLHRAARLAPPLRVRPPASPPELSVLFCGDARMRALNRRYRGVDRSTDVLAFPGQGRALGDIVVSLPYAVRQARLRAEPPAREVDRLLLHGYLHLLGYDHETDHGEMERLEARLRDRLGISAERGPATLVRRRPSTAAKGTR